MPKSIESGLTPDARVCTAMDAAVRQDEVRDDDALEKNGKGGLRTDPDTPSSPRSAMLYAHLAAHSRWFATLTPEQQQLLFRVGKVRRLIASQRLFARGDAFDGIYVVVKGAIAVSGVNHDGKTALLSIMEDGDWFGEIALFDQQARTHDAEALIDAELWHWSPAVLQRLLADDPLWWQRFGTLLTDKIRLVFASLEDMSLQPAIIRLARRLLMLSRVRLQQHSVLIPIQQEQLGQLLSLSRQTTNQLLQQLSQQGVLTLSYGAIHLVDLPKLRQIAQWDEFNHADR